MYTKHLVHVLGAASVTAMFASGAVAAAPAAIDGRSVAATYFSKVMSKCGSDYFVRDRNVSITQMRSVTLLVDRNPITDADRMNGVEERFIAYAVPKAWRLRLTSWSGNGGWNSWGDWRPECFSSQGIRAACNVAPMVNLEKRHGVWVYSTSGLPAFDPDDVRPIDTLKPTKASCDDPGLAQ